MSRSSARIVHVSCTCGTQNRLRVHVSCESAQNRVRVHRIACEYTCRMRVHVSYASARVVCECTCRVLLHV